MTVYCLLWPLYTAPSDELESTREGSLEAAPTYPEVLREAVARLFTTGGARVDSGWENGTWTGTGQALSVREAGDAHGVERRPAIEISAFLRNALVVSTSGTLTAVIVG